MVVPPQRDGGQAQFADAPVPATLDDDVIGRTERAAGHLHEPLTVEDPPGGRCSAPHVLPAGSGVTGMTPMQWLLRQRVLHAHTSKRPTRSIEIVAQQCGFGTATSFRTHFRRGRHVTGGVSADVPPRCGRALIPCRGIGVRGIGAGPARCRL